MNLGYDLGLGRRSISIRVDGGAAAAIVTPDQVAGIDGWWKADSLALANDTPVQTWTDSSGLGRNLTQATATQRPLYKTSGMGPSSKPYLQFGNISGTTRRIASGPFGEIVSPTTIVLIGSLATDLVGQYFSGIDNVDRQAFNSSASIYAGSTIGFTGLTMTGEAVWIIRGLGTDGGEEIWKSGAAGTVNPAGGGVKGLGGLRLGANWDNNTPANMACAEFILYGRELTNAELNDIQDYAVDKYGIACTPI